MSTEQQPRLRILFVAYPLLPVTENSAGGAEQVLWALERELHARGHHTVVAAAEGSQVAGELFSTGNTASSPDQFEARDREQTGRLLEWLNSGASPRFDLVHDQSGGFWRHAGRVAFPMLATLHLPRSFYPEESLSVSSERRFFNCVSESQAKTFSGVSNLLGWVPNGIALDRFRPGKGPPRDREYLLWLGRICEEKGPHIALDVAHEADRPIILAGQVYPFLYHQKYFAREIIPRLKRAGGRAKFVNTPSFTEKIDLLGNARTLLLTSLVEETSSIAAMEAAACGTPVYAFRRGALPEVIAEGVNGRLFNTSEEVTEALKEPIRIDSVGCQKHAEKSFAAKAMADGYERIYQALFAKPAGRTRPELSRYRAL